jgi:hypothetical protein
MPNYELGFGSPFYSNQPNGDMGFGAPFQITYDGDNYSTDTEQGFGDKLEVVVSFIGGEQVEYGDEGGQLIKVKGNWRDLFSIEQQYAGPFQIKVKNGETTTICKSGLPTFPTYTWANNLGKEIAFILPSGLSHGIYDIEIYYGPDFSQLITIATAIEIKKGLKDINVVNLKYNMPQFYDLGIRSDYGKSIETEYDNNKSNIEQILTAIGEEISTIVSGKYTILSQDAQYDDDEIFVETTCNFPNVGLIKVGIQEFVYSSKTDNSFILKNKVKDKITKFTPVNLLNNSLSDIDNYYLRQIYQYIKPSSFTIKNDIWDNTFRYLQFADRHVFPNTYNYFSSLTSQYDFINDCYLANASTQVFIIADITKEFNSSHVDRFIEIDDIVYYSERLVDTAHIDDPEITVKGLKLVSICDTSIFRKAEFTDYSATYSLKVKPFNIFKDFKGYFDVDYEQTIFPSTPGFIEKDYINYNIFFDNLSEIGESNFIDFLVTGILGKITRKRKTNEAFGTYIVPTQDPDYVSLEPDNEIL